MSTAIAPISQEIGKLLCAADDDRLLAVMDMIERLQARDDFEHHLEPIRPKLALLRPPRPATLKRIIVTPFEHALVPNGHWLPGCGSIERRHLDDLLTASLQQFDAEAARHLTKRMAPLKMNHAREICALGQEIWSQASLSLRSMAVKSTGAFKEQWQTACELLDVADLMCPLIESLPAFPMGGLGDRHVRSIKQALIRCETRGPEALTAGIRWLLLRSFKPLPLLKLLLRGEIGTQTIGREILAHRMAREILLRQEIALTNHELAERSIYDATSELEIAAGSFLSIAERAREFDLTKRDIERVQRILRELILSVLSTSVNDNYFRALDTLDNPDLPDDQVERIEAEARAVQRLLALADACGTGQQAQELVAVAAENAAAELRGRYGAKANPMTVVDQIRTFEFVFGESEARKLWQEFARRRQTGFEMSAKSDTPTPAQAMRSALRFS